MYVIHFLSLVFFLNLIRGSSGVDPEKDNQVSDRVAFNQEDQTMNKTSEKKLTRPLVPEVIQKLWGDDKKSFNEMPERQLLVEMLEHLADEPTVLIEKDTGKQGDVQTEGLQANAAQNSFSEFWTQKKSLLLNFAGSVNSNTREKFNDKEMTQYVQDLLSDKTMLSDLEPIIGELYKEFVEDLYLNIDDKEIYGLHSRFVLTVSNEDFLYVAADMVMLSPESFEKEVLLDAVGLMWKNMSLRNVGSYFADKGFTLENTTKHAVKISPANRIKTMSDFTRFKQTVLDNITADTKNKKREAAKNRAEAIIKKEKLKEEPKEKNFVDLILESERKAYELRDVISALELVIQKPKPRTEDKVKLADFATSNASDICVLLDITAKYSYKSAIAQFLLSRRTPEYQKKVFGKFFGRKVSELIAKLPQAGKIDLLRKFLNFIGSNKDKAWNYTSEILLRFPHLLTVKAIKHAADLRIRYWSWYKIEAFLNKLKEIGTDANFDLKETTTEITTILSKTFHGLYDNIANTILNSSQHQPMPDKTKKPILETLSNEPNRKLVHFAGEKDHFSNFFECEFKGNVMFGKNEEVTCHRTEKWMMLHKALLFDDDEIASLIKRMDRADIDPREFGKLGQVVNKFNFATWNAFAEEILYQGNALKFIQDEELFKKFKGALVKGDIFVEANKHDQAYGIGLAKDDSRCENIVTHRGDNTFGRILTKLWKDMFETNFSEVDANAPITILYPSYPNKTVMSRCNSGPLSKIKRNRSGQLLVK